MEPMYARLVNELLEGKWLEDSRSCSKGVILWSRRGNLFTEQFPHIARACERLPPGALISGVARLIGNAAFSFLASQLVSTRNGKAAYRSKNFSM